ncbi:MAG: FAD-linked oxidase C-terminal domain-containing protein [Burkholderiales bacterium]
MNKLQSHMNNSSLATRLRREIEGDVWFDTASRGRYSTDASIYQIEPVGVVVPKTEHDAAIAIQIAREERIAILPRGAGTSQCGQTVGAALIIDNSKYLRGIFDYVPGNMEIDVQPGVVLDQLNAALKPHGLWFPVDVSTSAQATIGGMAGNNSCGSRSIRYGNMVHNVKGIEAILSDGNVSWFTEIENHPTGNERYHNIVAGFRSIAEREADEIRARFPPLLRRVAGYNLDIFAPQDPLGYATQRPNMAHLLVGSEGTLAYFKRIRLKLSPLPRNRTLGVVNFASFYQAMELTQHIVKLQPTAVELVDRTMIALARDNPAFRPVIDHALIGEPDAILLVEFAGEDSAEQSKKLDSLAELLADLGLLDSIVKLTNEAQQKALWDVRKAGLNIMMSMKGDGKPISFIEDCCVPLEHLAGYTQALTEVFAKHGTRGTWYAHASVGTLHVRPILNMKLDGASKMRGIAEEACELVRRYKGVYSGEHGDGLVRSEWIAPFFGPRLTAALAEVKALFDPLGMMNPGKIVNPSKQDDRNLFRYKPGYKHESIKTVLDWSSHGSLAHATEMCNNNGHCRKFDADVMCPSYRVTRDEQHLTRGRANTLRLALSGQLGSDGFTSEAMRDSMDLCVSCKGCRRECPTGVDMAKMKIEFLNQYQQRHGLSMKDKLIAYLPRYAPVVSKLGPLLNLRNTLPGLRYLTEKMFGFSKQRALPRWRRDIFNDTSDRVTRNVSSTVALFVDTFTRYFEPENAQAAIAVLEAAGYAVHILRPENDKRPLCCGRTFLSVGLVEEAKREAERFIAAARPYLAQAAPIIGLEPSCLFTLRDEFPSLLQSEQSKILASNALTFEEFLAREKLSSQLRLKLQPIQASHALVHGHCHQKAFGVMPAVEQTLRLIPDLSVETISSSCCGMAGAFGYDAKHYDVSMRMAELSLLPAVRKADDKTLLVANGVSCRQQIHHGAGRQAIHVARVLQQALSRSRAADLLNDQSAP